MFCDSGEMERSQKGVVGVFGEDWRYEVKRDERDSASTGAPQSLSACAGYHRTISPARRERGTTTYSDLQPITIPIDLTIRRTPHIRKSTVRILVPILDNPSTRRLMRMHLPAVPSHRSVTPRPTTYAIPRRRSRRMRLGIRMQRMMRLPMLEP
jgi:hypothetical protein